MAFEISNGTTFPHATSHSDLFAKIRTFVNANGGVEMEYVAGDRYIVKLTGSGTDEIYIGLQIYANATDGSYALILQGFTGYTSGQAFGSQLGAIPTNPPALALWNTTIPYWLFLSNRRLIIVAKVGTTYHMAYLGWILPYATPSQWPYPLCVGGSTYRGDTNNSNKPFLYSATTGHVCNFWSPVTDNSSLGTLLIRTPSGWQRLLNNNISNFKNSGTHPYYQALLGLQRSLPDGQYAHKPIILIDGGTQQAKLGVFDGLRYVTGYNQTAESTVTDGGDGYIAFQNVFRTANNHWVWVKQA